MFQVRRSTAALAAIVIASCAARAAAQSPSAPPPPGFTSLFDGRTLEGWRGRQPNYNPAEEAALPKDQLAAKQAAWNAARDLHWKVDPVRGEIVSDGESPHLATVRDYGDFELLVDWRMVSPNGDSGIYLRGYPQVQIWDPNNAREVKSGVQRGSGALWNNNPDNPGRWPLVRADNPVGQWNTLRIRMIGSRVWVWLNGRATVDGQVLDNFFDRAQPIVARGPIELQTHGSEIRFRNISLREIPPGDAGGAAPLPGPAPPPGL